MRHLVWWMRIVGALYLVNAFMMIAIRAPIRSTGPPGILELADAGDATAEFVIDTWIGFGLEVAAIGVALIIFSRLPHPAAPLVWCVIGIELTRGVAYDLHMLANGYPLGVFLRWIVIHSLVIGTGIVALRRARRAESHPYAAAA